MLFWVLIIALALVVGVILGVTLLRGNAQAEPPAAYDLRVYRDQLKEVDRDLARGVINEGDADRVRTEISRRILAADAQLREGGTRGDQPREAGWIVAAVAGVLIAGGSALLYNKIGVPGYSDLPLKARIAASDQARAERLTQAEAEALSPLPDVSAQVSDSDLALMDQLRTVIADRPNDLEGLALLARNEAALGNLVAAHTAQAQIIEVKGDAATAQDYAYLADLMISAASGYVSKEAEAALRATLERDPQEPRARYYLGLYLAQVDRPDAAFRMWERLLQDSRPEAPWVTPIRAQIEELAWLAGVSYSLPPLETPPGPTEADIAAAANLSAEERGAMVRGMVEQLSVRLATEGGSPQEWVRLIFALTVLGDTERAQAIWQEAQVVFANDPEALDMLDSVAEQAGTGE